jgi:hypothetical protein
VFQEKKAQNERNAYNENFAGIYCVCAKPYPSDDDTDGEMLQCIVCEDWFHAQVGGVCLHSQFIHKSDILEKKEGQGVLPFSSKLTSNPNFM